jgi:predicted Zn-dependent protease
MDRSEEEETLGLFGFNAQKKLSKANEHLAKGNHYEARMAFEEIILRKGVPALIVDQARSGYRKARQALMENLIEEAKRLVRGGETDAAREACAAAIEQAGEDLEADEAKELLERLDEGQTEAARLLEGLDQLADSQELPAEKAESEEAAPMDGAEELFEALLLPLPEEQAEAFRSFGPEFKSGYLLLQEGRAEEALEQFALAPEDVASNQYFRLENAQAFMFSRRYEEALRTLEGLDLPEEHERRLSEMRIYLLNKLERGDEAIEQARQMWEESGADRETALLYTEMLLENGRAQEAEEVIKPLHSPHPDPEVDSLLVRAYVQLEKTQDARDLLEPAVEGFFQNPIAYQRRFPIWAARDLLALYIGVGEEPQSVRSIVQHLIRYDPESAEEYKAALKRYVEEREKQRARPRLPDIPF